MIRSVFCFIIFLIYELASAQNPSYYILGGNELADVDIYGITQDQTNNYWLATNYGVFKYDGYQFQNISTPKMVDKSIFGWQKDSHGNLYCNNLTGQIFKVSSDHIEEYFKIPDSLLHKDISFVFDKNDRLIIRSKGIFLVEENELKVVYQKERMALYTPLFKYTNEEIWAYDARSQQVVMIKDNTVLFRPIGFNQGQYGILDFHYLNDSLVITDRGQSRFVSLKKDSALILPPFISNQQKGKYRFFSTGKHFFAMAPTGGFVMFDARLKPMHDGKLLLQDEFISAMYWDNEGNLVMGTFQGGIYVIPDLNFFNIDFKLPNSKFTQMTDADSSLFLGTQSGRVFQLDKRTGTMNNFLDSRSKRIELLEYIHGTRELFVDDNSSFLQDLSTGSRQLLVRLGSVKDIEPISDMGATFSTSDGVIIYDYSGQLDLASLNTSTFRNSTNFHRLEEFRQRTYCALYVPEQEIVFGGTSVGLKIQNSDSVYYFLDDGIQLNCSDIKMVEGLVYVSTLNRGVYVFDGNQLVDRLHEEKGLLSNTVYAMQEYQGKCYFATEKGLQILHSNHSIYTSLTVSEGLKNDKLVDFVVADGAIWLMAKEGLQKILLQDIAPYSYVPSRPELLVLQGEDTVDQRNVRSFDSDHSKFEFLIRSPSLRYQNEITYHYQLSGIDASWQENTYLNNRISYLSLPPGDYDFMVKTVCRGVGSGLVNYSFSINPPFYNTWWFMVVTILGVLLISGGGFTLVYLRQKRKAAFQNELNESKLSAIRSQMNPHFIFNALNSIQDYIVLNEKRLAGKYLGKFADLMRIYLNHSQLRAITIREEVEALTLYLELEKLRFEPLIFTVDVDDQLDVDLLEIPTLIIQPIVENALKHGLLSKKGAKIINIKINSGHHGEFIRCEVKDNGIGRTAAAQVNRIRNPVHQSFATKATQTRLELLNKTGMNPLSEKVIDHYDEKGQATGTTVVLHIPILN